MRVPELLRLGSPRSTSWDPPPSFRERILRAVGTPAAAGALVFVAAALTAVILVMVEPHSPEADSSVLDTSALDSTVLDSMESSGNGGQFTESTHGAEVPDAAATVWVHVTGEVHSPGVVEIPLGSRVLDAIAEAGGATDAAVLEGINLARVLTDGEQLVVPNETAAEAAALAAAGTQGEQAVSLNTSSVEAFETLPRVGPSLAQRIVDWRSANGPFTSIDELLEVSGIGQKTLEGFRDRVTL